MRCEAYFIKILWKHKELIDTQTNALATVHSIDQAASLITLAS